MKQAVPVMVVILAAGVFKDHAQMADMLILAHPDATVIVQSAAVLLLTAEKPAIPELQPPAEASIAVIIILVLRIVQAVTLFNTILV